MEQGHNQSGESVFADFVKNTPEGISNFDYFNLLDHISQNKIDKDLIAAIFCESKIIQNKQLFINIGNKPFEEKPVI